MPLVVLRDGFRIFFLSAGVFAVLAIALWLGWIGIHAAGGWLRQLPFAYAPHIWHAHEMIYGYGAAVLGGFVLTAVPGWTDTPPARVPTIATLAALWLAGRVAILFSAILPAVAVMIADLAFLLALAVVMAASLAARPKPQNVMVLGVLALFWIGNLLGHLEWTGVLADGASRGDRTGLMTLAAMIAIIGGRVTPAFTRNAMMRARVVSGLPVSNPKLDAIAIAAALSLPLLMAVDVPRTAIAVAAGLAGVAQIARLSRWRSGWTFGQPILWSLHLGFAMLALGYGALAAASLGYLGEVAALHVIGIGAVGGMTLAVMSRAILGHTGRPLIVPRAMAFAYALVFFAALTRAAGSSAGLAAYAPAMLGSGLMWCLAFFIFVVCYWHPLIEPADPGKRVSG